MYISDVLKRKVYNDEPILNALFSEQICWYVLDHIDMTFHFYVSPWVL